jgi:hypothetical protein
MRRRLAGSAFGKTNRITPSLNVALRKEILEGSFHFIEGTQRPAFTPSTNYDTFSFLLLSPGFFLSFGHLESSLVLPVPVCVYWDSVTLHVVLSVVTSVAVFKTLARN